ncbi:HNH endonuclease signature motif containing protein [Nonlabens dokdonensis]|uniref:HNH endonuclease signature motif containing protein n=1 Tax=Nonlabens dokdonensis TaxID=328515 RepID=UPI0026ECB75F|nr:HNH endonuclease signature motif containing protein [Nonlabens dokdonensis]
MVFRTKDFDNPPALLTDSKWDTIKANLLIEKSAHKISDKCYRDCTKEALTRIYKDKCAICERLRGTELQVDHYRPKKPRDNKSQAKYNQPGYYWLAYTWSNLIPLCSKCNGNKSNKFPLTGWSDVNRISSHINVNGLNPFNLYDLNWLQQQELPLIVNPEQDKTPERHFSFNRNGKIVGRSPEGEETILVCKLNRKDLIRERLEIREGYVNAIKSALYDFTIHGDQNELKGELISTFKQIKLNAHPDKGHSYFNLFIYKYFDYFIDAKLPENLRGKSTTYFKQWDSMN